VSANVSPSTAAPHHLSLSTPHSPLVALLLTLADDELVIGYWDTEWTGIAPALEEDVAMSSIAQDEIGHALAFYTLLQPLTGIEPDTWALGREPEEFRFARLIGQARGDWAMSIARRFLYETADAVRLAALERSSYTPLAQLVAKMRREEQYHLTHFQTWFERFLAQPGDSYDLFVAALERAWPDALDLFASLDDEDELIADGILPEPMLAIRERWQTMLQPALERAGVTLRGAQPPEPARRGGLHPDFAWLHSEMTMVYRSQPGAEW